MLLCLLHRFLRGHTIRESLLTCHPSHPSLPAMYRPSSLYTWLFSLEMSHNCSGNDSCHRSPKCGHAAKRPITEYEGQNFCLLGNDRILSFRLDHLPRPHTALSPHCPQPTSHKPCQLPLWSRKNTKYDILQYVLRTDENALLHKPHSWTQFGFSKPFFWIGVKILESLRSRWILLCMQRWLTLRPHIFPCRNGKDWEVEGRFSANIRKREFRSPRKKDGLDFGLFERAQRLWYAFSRGWYLHVTY